LNDEQANIEKEMNRPWHYYLFAAFRFLTILPFPSTAKMEDSDFGKSMAFFPVVGLVQGLILLAVYAVFSPVLRGAVVDILLLLVLVLLAGGLHIDGFCDTVDGLAGGRDRENTLRIMKDSSVGSFAVAGIALLFLLKYAGLSSLTPGYKGGVILSMPVFSLWSMVLLARLYDYAREEGGTGKAFVDNTSNRELAAASIITLIFTILAMGINALLVFLLIGLVTLLFGEYSRHRLGGVTGDVLGAAKEANDALVLVFALIFMPK